MKDTLASLIRHATTALLALGGLLASRDFIDPSDVAAVDAAGVSLQSALVVIVVAIAGRLAIFLAGKIFPAAAAKLTRPEAGGPLAVMGWIVVGTLAGGLGCLPACSNGVPLRIGIVGPDGTVSYSSKGGLAVDYRSSK